MIFIPLIHSEAKKRDEKIVKIVAYGLRLCVLLLFRCLFDIFLM